MTGTTLAQIIPLLVTPALTRLYSPEEFGFLAVCVVLVGSLATFVTGKYENSIYLANSGNEAKKLVELTLLLVLINSILVLIVFLFFGDYLWTAMKVKYAPVVWIYGAPLVVFCVAASSTYTQYFIRRGKYKEVAFGRVTSSTVNVTASLAAASKNFTSGGLLIGYAASQGCISALQFFQSGKIRPQKTNYKKYLYLLRKYKNFPTNMLPASLLNMVSANMPTLILTAAGGVATAGQYALIQRVLGLPSSMLGASVGDVFRQQAADDIRAGRGCLKIFLSTSKKLFLVAALPFIFFLLAGPNLFGIIFGAEWIEAGELARILAPMFFIRFIVMPVSSVILLANKTMIDFWWQLAFLLATLAGFLFRDSVTSLFYYFAIAYSLLYLASYYLNYRLALRL